MQPAVQAWHWVEGNQENPPVSEETGLELIGGALVVDGLGALPYSPRPPLRQTLARMPCIVVG